MKIKRLIIFLLLFIMSFGTIKPPDAEAQIPGIIARHPVRVFVAFGVFATLAVQAGRGSPAYQKNVSFLKTGLRLNFITGRTLIYAALQTLVFAQPIYLIAARELAEDLDLDATKITTGRNPDYLLYRVYGGKSMKYGNYWTPVDPKVFGDQYRNIAGLPLENSGDHLAEAVVLDRAGFIYAPASAIPVAGTAGGLPEVFIPDPKSQLRIVSDVSIQPPF